MHRLAHPQLAPGTRCLTSVRSETLGTLYLSFAFAILLGWASQTVIREALVGVDDADIYMVYGRNVATGQGFVYNPGGERVEGFTSFAWTLIVAATFWIAPAYSEHLLFIISIAILAMTWFVLVRFACSGVAPTRAGPLLLVLLFFGWCLSSPAYGMWVTTSLMETGLWSLTISAGTVLFARLVASERVTNPWAPAALAGVAVLVRPEAQLIVPMWIVSAFIAAWAVHRDVGRALRAILPALVVFVIAVGALTAFRLAYFGYPLPNTFYAKLSPNRSYNFIEGLRYLRDFFVSFPLTVVILIGCVLTLASFVRRISAGSRARPPNTARLKNAPW